MDKVQSEDEIQIECTECNGHGCKDCQEGHYSLIGCPREYCDAVAFACNVSSMAATTGMPVSGGLLDQSAWFVDLHGRLQSEVNQIQNDQAERRRHH